MNTDPKLFTSTNWLNLNRNNPTANLFSRLEDLNLQDLKQPDGKYHFYLCYPETPNPENPCIIFKQIDNPLTLTGNQAADGFEIIKTISSEDLTYFEGFRANSQAYAILNGNLGATIWWYAIGSKNIYTGNTLPGVRSKPSKYGELYVIYPV